MVYPIATCALLGLPVAIIDYNQAVKVTCEQALQEDRISAVAAANTHLVTLARQKPEFARAMECFDLILPDGMPLIWCMNRFCNAGLTDRVYGPTFMLKCMKATAGRLSHFLLGGSQELLANLQQKLSESVPGTIVAGSYAPPFGEWASDEDEPIIKAIEMSQADFVWVGLGCPKQELWIARNKDRLPPGVYCAVGAAFAFHAGLVKQAPLWMQDRGLEWLFRLATEPRRLWRRYFFYNSLFLYYLAKESLRR